MKPDMGLYDAITQACRQCKSRVVSLSGGLDSTILTYVMRKQLDTGITVLVRGYEGTDQEYCQLAANCYGLHLYVTRPDPQDLLVGVSETIKILGNFNDIEIRNGVVMYLAIKEAKEQGAVSIVTGDGADELFAGYDFMLKLPASRLLKELKRIRTLMHFTSQCIGRHLRVSVESPFLHPDVVNIAASLPAQMLVGSHHKRRFGKMILRQLFAEHIPSRIVWRPKSPMQDGAGTVGLTRLLNSQTSDAMFQAKADAILDRDHIRIRNKESLFYYEKFYEHFGPLQQDSGASKHCPYCRYGIDSNSRFCRMCGAFPI